MVESAKAPPSIEDGRRSFKVAPGSSNFGGGVGDLRLCAPPSTSLSTPVTVVFRESISADERSKKGALSLKVAQKKKEREDECILFFFREKKKLNDNRHFDSINPLVCA